jgi:hypothetical protein
MGTPIAILSINANQWNGALKSLCFNAGVAVYNRTRRVLKNGHSFSTRPFGKREGTFVLNNSLDRNEVDSSNDGFAYNSARTSSPIEEGNISSRRTLRLNGHLCQACACSLLHFMACLFELLFHMSESGLHLGEDVLYGRCHLLFLQSKANFLGFQGF